MAHKTSRPWLHIYPIDTRWYRTEQVGRYVSYWQVVGDGTQVKAFWCDGDDRGGYFLSCSHFETLDGWRIEYPKEALFDQLYLRML